MNKNELEKIYFSNLEMEYYKEIPFDVIKTYIIPHIYADKWYNVHREMRVNMRIKHIIESELDNWASHHKLHFNEIKSESVKKQIKIPLLFNLPYVSDELLDELLESEQVYTLEFDFDVWDNNSDSLKIPYYR